VTGIEPTGPLCGLRLGQNATTTTTTTTLYQACTLEDYQQSSNAVLKKKYWKPVQREDEEHLCIPWVHSYVFAKPVLFANALHSALSYQMTRNQVESYLIFWSTNHFSNKFLIFWVEWPQTLRNIMSLFVVILSEENLQTILFDTIELARVEFYDDFCGIKLIIV